MLDTTKNTVKVGDIVSVIVEVWREDETPSAKNFYTGIIREIVERTRNCYYVLLEGLNRLIPMDRVCVA